MRAKIVVSAKNDEEDLQIKEDREAAVVPWGRKA